jgi:hypothetical protein
MTWVLTAVATWLLLAIVVALLVGRSIRLADREKERAAAAGAPNFAVDPGTLRSPAPAPSAVEGDEPAAAPPSPSAAPPIPRARQAAVRGCVQPGERHPSSRGAGLL